MMPWKNREERRQVVYKYKLTHLQFYPGRDKQFLQLKSNEKIASLLFPAAHVIINISKDLTRNEVTGSFQFSVYAEQGLIQSANALLRNVTRVPWYFNQVEYSSCCGFAFKNALKQEMRLEISHNGEMKNVISL
jgi:hypothetical protein